MELQRLFPNSPRAKIWDWLLEDVDEPFTLREVFKGGPCSERTTYTFLRILEEEGHILRFSREEAEEEELDTSKRWFIVNEASDLVESLIELRGL